jgi:hypothetical protein
MPRFILDLGTPEAGLRYARLDPFIQGYIQAMFFTDTGTRDDEENGLENAAVSELSPESWESIIADCTEFQNDAASLLACAYEKSGYDPERAGKDFWYTRNGHGVGFWDRGLGDVGDQLSALCGFGTKFRECYVYRGNDQQIHIG